MKKIKLMVLSIMLVLSISILTGCDKENNSNQDTATLIMNK